jgi:hypothetical protein
MTGLANPRNGLVGTRLPEGSFTIDPDQHRIFTDNVFAGPWEHEHAHPLFLHLVAHCGKGMPLEEFFALIGTELDAGVTFGQGTLTYHRPLTIGATYRVITEIADVTRKHGRRRGAFDVVTCHIDVYDGDDLVGVSRESYVVPEGT